MNIVIALKPTFVYYWYLIILQYLYTDYVPVLFF
jgi:hypothetical protein